MWQETKLEKFVSEKLGGEIGESDATDFLSHYAAARSELIDNVLEEIKASEPDLSDHGPRHIQDVMENAWQLIEGRDISALSAHILCVSILYHDVGNIFGRVFHNQRVVKVFNDSYSENAKERNQIRALVNSIAGAHTGKTQDGSENTLNILSDEHLLKRPINAQELAAVLRLADELAEGGQRTSKFKIKHSLFTDEKGKKWPTKFFHIYASCCDPAFVQRQAKRIALKYHLSIEKKSNKLFLTVDNKIPLNRFLEFIYMRIKKLDQERKYCKHYSDLYLSDFKETSVVFDFWLDDEEPINFDREPLILNDYEVPGHSGLEISDKHPEYQIDKLVDHLKDCIDA